MTIFWILAAGFTGIAVLFAVVPLLSKPKDSAGLDQDQLNLRIFQQQLRELDEDLAAGNLDRTQYKAARRDLERELLYDLDHPEEARAASRGIAPVLALSLALALPAFAFGLYSYLGDPQIIPRLATATQDVPDHSGAGITGRPLPSLEELVQRLAERMEQHPDNLEGWLMLGRSYFALNQPKKALAALERAYALDAHHPAVLLAYAQALAANAGGDFSGRPETLLDQVLAREPNNQTARWLKGVAAYQAGDFPEAVKRWETLRAELQANHQDTGELETMIAAARRKAGLSPESETRADPVSKPSASGTDDRVQLEVRVSLDEALWKQADVNDRLFIYAKAASGPPMPLAVKQLKVGDLPATVVLDDSLALMPALRLSQFSQVILGARIAKSGQATPQPGDLEGEVGPLAVPRSEPVELVIDRVRP